MTTCQFDVEVEKMLNEKHGSSRNLALTKFYKIYYRFSYVKEGDLGLGNGLSGRVPVLYTHKASSPNPSTANIIM
jgi:hypothetical protein